MSSSPRLIERWLPITEIGIESLRERTPMTPFPAPNRLHVWWARRPLVASRAAILASLLPADADHKKFMRALGVHGDPVASRRKIDQAKRTGVRFEGDAYSYERAFKYTPTETEKAWFREQIGVDPSSLNALDPTGGGGSVPLEALRLGLATVGNDLNPVAAFIQKATYEWPAKYGMAVVYEFNRLAAEFVKRREERLKKFFPAEPEKDCIPTNFIWARTVRCPYCEGVVPLSPNWRLAPDGTGVRLKPNCSKVVSERVCEFEIVQQLDDHSGGTIADGDASCPFTDCGRVVEGDEIKKQAQAGLMGEQLYAVVFKRRTIVLTKTGKERVKWVRGYRAPVCSDNNAKEISDFLSEKMPEWEAMDVVPNEEIPVGHKTDEPRRYGMLKWLDIFSPRQVLVHGTSGETIRELLLDPIPTTGSADVYRAALCYLCSALDKLRDYNSRMTRWHSNREVMVNTFDRHDFAFKWSYAEMSPLVKGVDYDWAIEQTAKCMTELVELIQPASARIGAPVTKPQAELGLSLETELPLAPAAPWTPPPITVTNKSGDALDHLADGSVDVVVMDPPYYDNVMYAELSDFFYVWLKRTAGLVFPELFRRQLTDKENEAVANPAKFRDQKGAKALAGRDYQERMARIFEECRRVLKPEGIMTLMFTHKATGAWDALTQGLMQAGFVITASWPINTEAEGSLHIKDKAAANSTIFLACRPRAAVDANAETRYWEDVEPLVAAAVRKRVAEFQAGGIRGVDLYLACFGPALEEFSRHWPLKRGTPKPEPKAKRRAQKELFPEERDPYEVTPEDALNAARREVKSWRLEQLTHKKAQAELDGRTAWFVLAWDAFQAPVFPYDEALRLARAVGVDLDADIVGHLAEKKGSDLILWDSTQRAAKHALGAPDGSQGMIDALHHAAHQARTRTLDAGRELLEKAGVVQDPGFAAALLAVLEVLPVSRAFGAPDVLDACEGAASDFEALEKLRRLAFSERVEAPKQLELWNAEQAKEGA